MLQRLEVLDGKIGFIHVALALLAAFASRLALKQWALPRIAELAKNKAYFTDQGIPWLFDGRKRGYSLVDAKMHLEALGYAARDYYATWYIPVYDLVFPVTLFVFGTLFCIWITQPGPGFAVSMHPRWRLAILVVPLALFVFDMLENLSVLMMLKTDTNPSPMLVAAASSFTQAKWVSAYVAGALATALLVLSTVNWWQRS